MGNIKNTYNIAVLEHKGKPTEDNINALFKNILYLCVLTAAVSP